MSEEKTFEVEVKQEEGFAFRADFGVGSLLMDEPEPVGSGSGPNASHILAAAIGNCLSASLLFCLQKSKVEVEGIKAVVRGIHARNSMGRWRVKELEVELFLKVAEEDRYKLERCAGIFEDFCIVSQSVRQGIPIKVRISE
ncbi:MAG: OsmC family protein [Candidatus Bathyarchaeota archaeon]|jgi:organic hydroperoxide reductase OsmC/OhrA